MFIERDRQDDCVGLECIPQRLGDDSGSNRPGLRCQRLRRAAAPAGHLRGFAARGDDLSFRILQLHSSKYFSDLVLELKFEKRPRRGQTCAMPPSTARSTPVMKELSSEARNVTAAAIASGLPLRPIGTCVTNWAAACSACSGVRPAFSKAGVSIGPGLTEFTRILRSFRSIVQPRAKLRTAALLAA